MLTSRAALSPPQSSEEERGPPGAKEVCTIAVERENENVGDPTEQGWLFPVILYGGRDVVTEKDRNDQCA
ncbi:hypothetical protein HPP92_016438 [Vanilla planifolia]|uniref:Uncharacterized protein n=1 Tax=Vanilla planifolia TaxID=51239 RepID=A0A835US27_VANPL|nr:hypothetical protein HPP92_016964 [Vanilla planifolia]KAG0471892.1 hypothetical protein HPP92_016438 [Vanilla planifolia]